MGKRSDNNQYNKGKLEKSNFKNRRNKPATLAQKVYLQKLTGMNIKDMHNMDLDTASYEISMALNKVQIIPKVPTYVPSILTKEMFLEKQRKQITPHQ